MQLLFWSVFNDLEHFFSRLAPSYIHVFHLHPTYTPYFSSWDTCKRWTASQRRTTAQSSSRSPSTSWPTSWVREARTQLSNFRHLLQPIRWCATHFLPCFCPEFNSSHNFAVVNNKHSESGWFCAGREASLADFHVSAFLPTSDPHLFADSQRGKS